VLDEVGGGYIGPAAGGERGATVAGGDIEGALAGVDVGTRA